MRPSSFAAAIAAVVAALAVPSPCQSEPTFVRTQLSTRFVAEGAALGDLDRDGHCDLVAGNVIYRGPAFTATRRLYDGQPFDPASYSDHFFAFVHDLDGDGWNDVVVLGFPGQDAEWYRNPRTQGGAWTKHLAFRGVDNESPTFTDLDGDGRPELVCMHDDRLGYAKVDWQQPEREWTWHPLSAQGLGGRFTHGLGVGDVNGDGRADVLWKHGVWLQPASLEGDPQWAHEAHRFSDAGGAQMLVFDVDGDGDADVVSSDHAHGYGLSWFEQQQADERRTFVRHGIMGRQPSDFPHGVAVGNLHALCAADLDGDGLLDVVTGNRFFAHGGRDLADSEPARLLWFRLQRANGTASFTPHDVDGHSGVGTQVTAGDADGDGDIDIVVANKMGAFLHRQERRAATAAALPRPRDAATPPEPVGAQPRQGQRAGSPPKASDGRILNFDFETGDLRDWTVSGDAFARVVDGDAVHARRSDMHSGHHGRYWIGSFEHGNADRARGTLTSAPFVLNEPRVSFLVGGGDDRGTRVEIVAAADGRVLHTAHGQNHEQMARIELDLRAHLGQQLFVRLVDDETGSWGHVNFDDFRLHGDDERSGGFPANETIARMALPPGFRAQVFAAEPDVRQPVAMAIDERGRVWIAEAMAYPQRRPDGQGEDRIVVFTDRDGDGTPEQRTVFLGGLNLVSGLEVGFGGVFVGAAPTLSFVPDRDGDLVPDGPAEVLLDGFDDEDTHETLNTFTWGPDGWLYGCHGVFTQSKVGKPGTPDDERQPLNAGVWRWHPTRHEFEVFAHGTSNPWGLDFDARGQAFLTACVIPHLYHVIQGGVYRRQSGSHFDRYVYQDLDTIADHRHYVGDDTHAANRISGSAGGGHAHCGALIQRGGRWPKAYDGAILMENIHGSRLNMDLLRRRGSGYVGSHGPDFLLVDDSWFLAVAIAQAHDGNVYVTDWYDDQHCHLREEGAWDRSNGRIYKIAYGTDVEAPKDLAAMGDAQLVALLFDQNEFYARRARRVLTERKAIGVAPALATVLADAAAPEEKRLRALWALHGIGACDDAAIGVLLQDKHEHMRAFAIQFAVEDRAASAPQLARFAQLAAEDPSPVVRLYLAAALQRLPHAQRWPIALALAARAEDVADANLEHMLWFGIQPAVPLDPQQALAMAAATPLPRVCEFVYRRLAEAGGEALSAALVAIGDATDARTTTERLEFVQRGLARNPPDAMPANWPVVRTRIERHGDAAANDAALWLAGRFGDPAARPRLLQVASSSKAPRDQRERAFELLQRQRGPELGASLRELVGDALLGEPALHALADVDDPTLAPWLLQAYGTLPPARRPAAIQTLCSRPASARTLLDAVAAGTLPRDALDASVRQRLLALGDDGVAQRLQDVFGKTATTSAATNERIAAWKQKLGKQALAGADLPNGRAVFARTCMTCHVLFGSGTDFGPDLTGSNRKDLDYLLGNILDPGREVARDSMLATVHRKDGSVLVGMLGDETEQGLTVRTQFDRQRVAKADVVRIERSEQSLMPAGQLDGLRETDVRDLVAYLGSDVQVPLRANADNAFLFWNGQDLRLWDADPAIWSVNDDGELVGRTTTGIPHNRFARSHLLLGDFELSFEVLLVGNQGNSGVQFRSEALADGDVRGYQADIGPGWWGKLYEEHGRALLDATDRDGLVKKGDWNRYRIVAVGSRVQTWLNDQPCVDLDDPAGAREGIVAVQLHSGGPTEVRFRNFELKLR
jgi:putative membrane-bound dehydrogenase-like protein